MAEPFSFNSERYCFSGEKTKADGLLRGNGAGSPSDSWNSGNHMDVFGTRCVKDLKELP